MYQYNKANAFYTTRSFKPYAKIQVISKPTQKKVTFKAKCFKRKIK